MSSETTNPIDPLSLVRPRRKILGISAILLPFTSTGDVDFAGFREHVARTAAAGLVPAVNMDTGYVSLINNELQDRVLAETRAVLNGARFVAGAFVADRPGDVFDATAYARRIEAITKAGGEPVIVQSFGLVQQADDGIVDSYRHLAGYCNRFIAFELTKELAPFGSIYNLATYGELMKIPACLGAKHSSFERQPEWMRIVLRDTLRPDFHVFTGNDLAIDMVIYGSDYLLGLSTMAPDVFAQRDACWEQGDPRFYEINDWLQYLGFFSFRAPMAAYKHTAAQFLKLRGMLRCDATHPQSPPRPATDLPILQQMADHFELCR